MDIIQCVFCDVTEGLNTQMTLTLEDGKKIVVSICDAHAEDATVKTAKLAYTSKHQKVDALLAQIKALTGQDVSIAKSNNSGLLIANINKPPVIKTNQEPIAESANDVMSATDGSLIVSTSVVDKGAMTSRGNPTGGATVESHSSYIIANSNDKLPDGVLDGQVKLEVTTGRGGQPIVIPTKRRDGTGTTRTKIVQMEDDAKLQTRFKKMADDSRSDRTPDFARSGYANTTRDCPLCHGDCTVKQRGEVIDCPKCKGSGIISVY